MFVKCLYIYNVALIEVEILFVFFFKKQKDWNGKQEHGLENAQACCFLKIK
jgi:hypothetical protein